MIQLKQNQILIYNFFVLESMIFYMNVVQFIIRPEDLVKAENLLFKMKSFKCK